MTLIISTLSVVNTLLWVQGPFLAWRAYPVIKRYEGLFIFSPFAIAGLVSAIGLFYYFSWFYVYPHFLYYPALFIVLYLVCIKKFHYERADALVLTFLSLVCVAMLWELPIFIETWTISLWNFQVGIASAGWEFMAIPILIYFLAKINGKLTLDSIAKTLLGLNLAFLPAGLSYDWPYWGGLGFGFPEVSLIVWFFFFIFLLSPSKRL